MRRRMMFVLVLILMLVWPLGQVAAQGKTFYWERFDVEITVNTDGTFWVEETQVINFTSGTFTFGYRNIPTQRLSRITDMQVSGDGRAYRESRSEEPGTFYTEREGNELFVYWYFSPAQGVHTYTLRYLVHGGLRYYDEGDQLWWDAVYPDRDARVAASRVTVQLPAGATVDRLEAYNVAARTSGEGATTARFEAQESIPPGRTFEVRVQFPHGVVSGSAASWQRLEDMRPLLNLALIVASALLLALGLVGLLLLWYLRGRDPQVQLPADILSTPPSDDPPGVVGVLVDEKADLQDIVATLVDLARRGYMLIEEQQESGFLGTTNREFTYRLTDKTRDDLTPFEKKLVRAVFGNGKTRRLTDLRERFYKHIPKLQEALYEDLVRRGYFPTNPKAVRGRYSGLGVGILVLGACGGFLTFSLVMDFTGWAICPIIAFVLIGIAALVVAQHMPHKSEAGAEMAERWKAFRRYLQDLERYTDLKEATDLFETYLPYAIAFGLEKSWVKKFTRLPAEVIVPQPIWYRPYYGGSAGRGAASPAGQGSGIPSLQQASDSMMGGLQGMSDGLMSMLNTTASTFTSSPSSSSSGGWSSTGSS